MTEENNKIIEINGVKFEVDARTATLRQISTIKIGARVKVLKKKYSDSFEVHHGVVIGFEPFEKNPTVIIAYLDSLTSSNPEIKFIYYTNKSEEQVIISDENDREALQAANITQSIEKQIAIKQREITDLEDKKKYFLTNFKSYWNPLAVPESETKDSIN